jgi:protein-tyrosine phosphatase
MAEFALQRLLEAEGMDATVAVMSAGTGRHHVGDPADRRAVEVLNEAGYDASSHRAQRFDSAWFADLDLVIALDRTHAKALAQLATTEVDRAKIHTLLSFDRTQDALVDVPDPYFSNRAAFVRTLDMVESAVAGLLHHVVAQQPGRTAK